MVNDSAVTKSRGRISLSIGLGGVFLVVVGAAFIASRADQTPTAASGGTTPAPTVIEPVPGSLGMYLDDIPERWNTVSNPPEITHDFTKYAESGDYDSFIYRFGDWGRLAGAYDRSNDAVYGLLATGQLANPATADLYLHMCHLVAPFSQECHNAYFENGLAGETLSDFGDLTHTADWQLGEHSWSVEIQGNVLIIRVAADSASQ